MAETTVIAATSAIGIDARSARPACDDDMACLF
jgi:hypothetical protein